MKTLLKIIKWDFILQWRYNIITIAIILSAIYILLLKSITGDIVDSIIVLAILSDPAMFGVLFIGVLVLYEKDNNTLQALVVTPLKSSQYLLSKSISLTLIAVPIALVIAIFGHGIKINIFYFLISIVLTSMMFVFLGFVIASKSKGFNQYIIKFALYTLPTSIPILGLFDIYQSALFYLIPTQATILLLKAAFNQPVQTWQLIYSVLFLFFGTILSFKLALKAYHKNL